MFNNKAKNTRAGAQIVIDCFIEKGILTAKDEDKKYGQSYVYKEYLDIFVGRLTENCLKVAGNRVFATVSENEPYAQTLMSNIKR